MNGGASLTTKEAPAYPFGLYTTPRLSPESARTRHARKMPLLDFSNGIVGETSAITGQCPNKLNRAIEAAHEKVYFLSVGFLFSGEYRSPALGAWGAGRGVVKS